MSDSNRLDDILIASIRAGDAEAWNGLIVRFEGRLLAFVESRIGNRTSAEDVVQETFIGFLTSLPNFDSRRSLESWLFSIAAHKLTDFLRKSGRRPTIPLRSASSTSDSSEWELPGGARPASSIVRSGERRGLEEKALSDVISKLLERWKRRGDWVKVECAELLFVRGPSNKNAASRLDVTEQQVANYKFEFLAKVRAGLRSFNLPEEIFPELYEEPA